MRPVTQELLGALPGSHRMVARARLCPPGQIGVDPDGDEIPILGGDVQFDATADIRATLQMTTAWPWPAGPGDRFNPYGSEIYVERGVVYGNGITEWVGLGYFRIDTLTQNNIPRGTVKISAPDRMANVVDGRALYPMVFGPGTTAEAMIEILVGEVVQGATFSYDFDPSVTAWDGNHVLEEDRYEFLYDIAQSLGKIMYFTYDGSFRMESPPDPQDPVWTIGHGAGGVLVDASRKITRKGVYNAVTVTGDRVAEGDGLPIFVFEIDDDPLSPTYWYGPFGRVPRYYSSSFIKTEAQATESGAAMLIRSKGLPYDVDLSAIPNPGTEVLDPVLVTYDNSVAAETHVLDQVTMPLTPQGAMTATSRKVKDGGEIGGG